MLVLERKEHQDRNQDDVNGDREDVDRMGQRERDDGLPHRGYALANLREDFLYLRLGNHGRVQLRQLQQSFLKS